MGVNHESNEGNLFSSCNHYVGAPYHYHVTWLPITHFIGNIGMMHDNMQS